MRQSLVFLMASVLVVGCGRVASGTDDEDAGTDGASDGSGGAASTLCDDLQDDESGRLEIFIRNERTTSVFLGTRDNTCGPSPIFSVSDAEQHDLPIAMETCSGRCESLRTRGPSGCPAICWVSPVLEIRPGQAQFIAWDTLVLESRTLAAECIASTSNVAVGTTCQKYEKLQPGTYTFRSQAGTGVDCSIVSTDSACPPCAAGAETCTYTGGMVIGDVLEAELTVTLDASYGIGELPPNSGGGDGSLNNIELRFLD